MATRSSARPSRREFLIGAGAGLVAAAATAPGCEPARRPAAAPDLRPNILFLLTDDQRWDTLGCMGNPLIRTPHVDRLASLGTVFENMFVTTSICMASRASFFTGQYTRCHGVDDFSKPLSPEAFALSYPERLRAAGYRTGFVGKYGVGPVPEGRFDFIRAFAGQGHYFPESPAARARPQDAGELAGPHQNALMADQAIEFLDDGSPGRPFCLSVSFKSPHCQDGDPRQFLSEPDLADLYKDAAIPAPATADPADFDRLPDFVKRSEGRRRWPVRFATPEMRQEMVRAYWRLISGVDRAVGRLCDALDARGLASNTVILFAGDNGFFLGEHGLAGKWLAYEESIRVPLVVYDPRLAFAQRGRRVREPALNIDVAPTILDLAGLPVPDAMQGRSLVALARGEAPPWRTDWFYEHTMLPGIIPPSEAVRDARYKYIRYVAADPPVEELYDLAADPHEARSLAADPSHADRLAALRLRWQTWHDALAAWRPDRAGRLRELL
ncbi:MAG: sulfatase [Planctomycetes bacterium]|nr:sulfatase [Planctomycetota bacterium]